jgi:hypothetical protein
MEQSIDINLKTCEQLQFLPYESLALRSILLGCFRSSQCSPVRAEKVSGRRCVLLLSTKSEANSICKMHDRQAGRALVCFGFCRLMHTSYVPRRQGEREALCVVSGHWMGEGWPQSVSWFYKHALRPSAEYDLIDLLHKSCPCVLLLHTVRIVLFLCTPS